MRVSKRVLIFAAAAIIAGGGSYGVGYSGVNVGQLVTQARCRSGAFLGHADVPKDLQADATDANGGASTTVAETDPALTIDHPVTTSGSNLIANPGAETVSGNNPAGWSNNHTGHNDASFSQVLGHNSNRGLRIDITDFKDGTADWFTGFTGVQPGAYYQFRDYYRSNVTTHATLALKDDQGPTTYAVLDSTPASTAWAESTARFFVPSNVHQIMVSHTLSRVGSLETDDYSLAAAAPAAFKQPLVSITFDDGQKNAHQNALPIMERDHLVSTQYIVSGFLGATGYDKPGDIYDYASHGHEIAAHTITHPDLTKLDDKALTHELGGSHDGLSTCYGQVNDFAAPYGNFNVRTTAATKPVYQTARSTSTGLNTADHFNPYELKVVSVQSGTTPEQLQAWLDTAKSNHVWLILVYHQVGGSGTFSRSTSDFESDMHKIVASGISVKTIHDAYAEVSPQISR